MKFLKIVYSFLIVACLSVFSLIAASLFGATAFAEKPEAPSDLRFCSYNDATTDLEMFWEPSTSNDVWGYVAYYSTDGGLTWKDAGYTRGDACERIAKGVGKFATYKYKVAAYNEDGNSPWIYGDWNYGEFIKPREIEFTDYDPKNKTVEISWFASFSRYTKYYPNEYSTDGGKTWKLAGNVKFNKCHRIATKVEDGTMFRVCTENEDGFRSPWVTATFKAN